MPVADFVLSQPPAEVDNPPSVERRKIDQPRIDILELDPHDFYFSDTSGEMVNQTLHLLFESDCVQAVPVLALVRGQSQERRVHGVEAALALRKFLQQRSDERQRRGRLG